MTMLELLIKYANDKGLAVEPGFKAKDVRWAIACDAQGRFLELIEIGDVGNKRNPGRAFAKCPDLSQSELIKGGITRSHFLIDTAEVVALLDHKQKESGGLTQNPKASLKHEFFVRMLREAGQVMPELEQAAQCLSSEEDLSTIRSRMLEHRVKSTEKVTLMVNHSFPVESQQWHPWWREFRIRLGREPEASDTKQKKGGGKKTSKQSPELMWCFATGKLENPAVTHPKIEGLSNVGGMPSGDVLIGFDKESFTSYGLSQSANAAVSVSAAAAYRAGLNHLVKQTGQRLAGAKVVHWFRTKVSPEDDPLSWLVEGNEQEEMEAQERARRLLKSIRTGEKIDLQTNYYYALTLSGAAGRIMVRDWMEGQFEELARSVGDWFDDLTIIRRDGNGNANSPKFLAVLGSTVRKLDDLPPPFVTKMWRVAVRGEAFPLFALAPALVRFRADLIQDEPPNHARMGLMKAYHIRKHRQMGGNPMTDDLKPRLNEEHPHPAYQCGRLMAMLAELQRRAIPDVGAGVVQRYYAAASSTPALILGRVTRLSQFHLNKLETPLARWYETKIAGIWVRIKDRVPRTLDLEEQSLFALGYYQQIADLRTKKDKDSNTKGGLNDE